MTSEHEQIEEAIAALNAQRAVLGDAVVELAIAPLRARLGSPTPLRDAGIPAQTLRQVTILFVDVVGSTALSQKLDPEDIHLLMDGLLARLTAIVVHHAGRVLQYAGDSLLAVFGYDAAREDDAERSVRAGLALLAEVRGRHGVDGIAIRAGIHTGTVLLGGGIDAEGSIRGHAVNVAARLEQTTAPNTLRVSRDCYRQVRDRFEVEAQPPVIVKGIADPVASYLVLREKPRAFNAPSTIVEGIGGESDEMIGREAELARVVRAIEDACGSQALQLFTVLADAGMGKSRLLVEVERLLGDETSLGRGMRVLHGRAQRHGINTPDGVLRDLMAWHCDILDSDEPQLARDKLAATFGAAFGERAAEQSALVGQLIGLDYANDPHIAGIVRDGRQIRARAFHAFAQYLRLLCDAHRGVVLLLDDLHWADDGSLDLIEFVATACADLPIVLGCFARSPLLDRRPTWGSAAPHAARIDLALLDADSGGRLVDALLAHVAAPPPELRALILESAEGNPFHIQEVLGMLIDDGVIVADADGWHVDHARLVQAKVPPTLIAVLQARLDALPSAEKQALQHESVVGSVFWDEALRVVAPRSIDALDMLVRRELINAHVESTFEGVREYEFKHHLLHQVTYDTVLKAAKRDLHKRTADWLVGVTGARIGEHLGLIADHYERAGEAASAVTYLRRAAEAAYATASYGAGLAWIERAFTLVGDDQRARFELHTLAGQLHNGTGRRVEQARAYEAMLACAEVLDDDAMRARTYRNLSLAALIRGDLDGAIGMAERADALAMMLGDDVTRCGAMLERGQAYIVRSEFDAAEATFLAALPIIAKIARPDLECVALNRLNALERSRGRYDRSRDYLERALAIARDTSNKRFEGGLLNNLATLELAVGQLDLARTHALEGLEISRAIGDRGSEPYPLSNLAGIFYELGEPERAAEFAHRSLEISRSVGDDASVRQASWQLGRAQAACGDVGGALASFAACDYGVAPPRGGSEGEMAVAGLYIDLGRIDDAAPLVERFAAHGGAGASEFDALRYFVCHRYFVAAGDPRADEFLVRAREAMVAMAAGLSDADRAAFFGNLRLHRAIETAWASRG